MVQQSVGRLGPAMSAPVPEFVGRDGAMASILGALRVDPALVLVEGEAGIGKTRLLQELLRAEWFTDRRVLVAACPPLREPFPLGAGGRRPAQAGGRGERG